MKRALWITCGPRGNVGDALLYDVTKALFDGLIDLDFRYVSEPVYLRPDDEPSDNVVIGPGGMFVQTNSSRHLHRKLANQWDQFESKRFFLWSTGILAEPTAEEKAAVRRVNARARKIIVRARKEAEFIRRIGPITSPEFAPCASLFADRLLALQPRKKDVVVVNFDSFLFTEENFSDHPLRRFREYANAQGLEVRSMVNAAGDSNRYSLDLFPLIARDQQYFGGMLADELEGRDFNAAFNAAIEELPSFGERYNECRFAFGKRLHAWLPFMAFDRPAAFIGMATRRGMPRDYFGDDDFLADVPRRAEMTRAQLDAMADGLIKKLAYFISHEDELSARIAATREELWQNMKRQADEFADALV